MILNSRDSGFDYVKVQGAKRKSAATGWGRPGQWRHGCWYLLMRTEKICKRTDTIVAFTRRVLNIVSTGKRVSQLRVLT
jgi:hypothetical protein